MNTIQKPKNTLAMTALIAFACKTSQIKNK
jgi:hypothetical protein